MRKISRVVAVGVGVVSLMGIAAVTATSSSAGEDHTFLVEKVVEGTQPAGTQYTIQFTCVADNVPDPQQVVIDGPGNVVSAALPRTKGGDTTCTVTEPDTGGATATFSCVGDTVAICEADNRVTFPEGEDAGVGTITVTNTFEEPAPPEPAAEAITTEPAFTG